MTTPPFYKAVIDPGLYGTKKRSQEISQKKKREAT
jgi:hypothetical protein